MYGKYLSSNLLTNCFAVKYREAVIAKDWQSKLFGVIGNLIN